MTERLSLPLPRGWPKQIRNAVLSAIGLERLALLQVRAGFEHSDDPRARLTSELDIAREQTELLQEQVRILGTRLARVPPAKRPHYPPAERLAILALRARGRWNQRRTAREFLVTSQTVARWQRVVEREGEDALVQLKAPVNQFDDAVTALVQHLHETAPGKGRRKKAALLMRAGLHLSASTVRRMSQRKPVTPRPKPPGERSGKSATPMDAAATKPRVVQAKYAHHVWHTDITAIPIGVPGIGYWTAWWPFAFVLSWLLSWHLVLVLDQFTRRLLAFSVTRREPSADDVCATLDCAVLHTGSAPKHLISDQGTQFQSEYRNWCTKHGAKPRYGAVGKHGSIAIIERFILSLKQEFLRCVAIPANHSAMVASVTSYQRWYNEFRPHAALDGRTPAEMLAGLPPPRERERIEPRARYPIDTPPAACVAARAPPAWRPRAKLALHVSYVDGYHQLPIVDLRDAA